MRDLTYDEAELAAEDRAELAAEDRADRLYRAKLYAHPDCRDPDHPGCYRCIEDDEDDSLPTTFV